jgi:hypothetical protein
MIGPPLRVRNNRQSRQGFRGWEHVSKHFHGAENYFVVFLRRLRQGRQRPRHEIIFGGEHYSDTSMFDTIFLLTGAVEQPVFASVLRGHNPRLTVLPVSTSDDLAAVAITVLRRARPIAFTTSVIVPQKALDQLKVFGTSHHGIAPTVNPHGIQFRAMLPGTAEA